MPKNKGKGGKKFKKGKKTGHVVQRDLIIAEDGQEYSRVEKMCGDARVQARSLVSGKVRTCLICGTMRRRVSTFYHFFCHFYKHHHFFKYIFL